MSVLRLPALRSDDTLGFLAALGVVELLRTSSDLEVRLGWEGVGGCAIVDIDVGTVSKLAQVLVSVATEMRSLGRLTPSEDADMVPKTLSDHERKLLGLKLEPLKMTTTKAVERFQVIQSHELSSPQSADAWWMTALVNQLAAANPKDPDERRLSPLYSPSGRMTLNQILREGLANVTDRPDRIEQALTGWLREPGTGGNLDERALVDGAQSSDGTTPNRAVLGASWLGMQSIPWFAQVGDGRSGDTILWTRSRRGLSLTWPVWNTILDVPAMRTLFRHPLSRQLAPTVEQRRKAQVLGLAGLVHSRRHALGNSAGPLRMPEVAWTTM